MASMSAADFGQFAQGSQESSEESQTSPSPFPSSMHESTANATWSRMLQGNKRFAEGKAEHPWQDKETRNMLTDGQKPDAAVLACAEQPNDRTASAVLIGSFAVLLALSYAVLPQPAFEPPAEPDSSSTTRSSHPSNTRSGSSM